ncbi:MAG: 2-amino-4-hydroxy-6-hydroxymethyldihydropteridine diphosphokinase [Bdellovibrionales bacterium]|jgi:2-amino-4-hydroxy-6-hydroxymethyldihydropteridine diphosphokinase
MNENSPKQHTVALSLGSNVGDRLAYLRKAKEALAPYVTLKACSDVYETISAYAGDQPLFLNAALWGTTIFDPKGLLYTIKDIELSLGRLPTFHYGPRTIDIDIVFFDDLVMHTANLVIPHKLMSERSFVLKPLADICPEWVHPDLGKTVQALWDELPKEDIITLIDTL